MEKLFEKSVKKSVEKNIKIGGKISTKHGGKISRKIGGKSVMRHYSLRYLVLMRTVQPHSTLINKLTRQGTATQLRDLIKDFKTKQHSCQINNIRNNIT